ncbi:MAG: hypothetical protein ACW964_11635, partial [Candidatus Hodarchaeales archaeon]
MKNQSIYLSEMKEADIEFLKDLWNDKKVMKFADEFPRKRGWSRKTDINKVWKIYNEKKEKYKPNHLQLIIY